MLAGVSTRRYRRTQEPVGQEVERKALRKAIRTVFGDAATALLSDLVERGLDPEQGILFVIDGASSRA